MHPAGLAVLGGWLGFVVLTVSQRTAQVGTPAWWALLLVLVVWTSALVFRSPKGGGGLRFNPGIRKQSGI